MDLTKLKHYLIINGVRNQIDEPIGFDGLQTTIKRGEYHGISAEVSVGTMEFYNTPTFKAADIIHAAYNNDIDTEIGYYVTDKDGVEVYSGVVDLATYSESTGKCRKISCKVGEIGVKTTFNNRTETEVDLNRTTTIDGTALKSGVYPLRLRIPPRSVVYTNLMQAREKVVWDKDNAGQAADFKLADDVSHQWISIPITGSPVLHEFGEQLLQPYAVYGSAKGKPSDPRVGSKVIADFGNLMFEKGSGFDEKYGSSSKYDIEIDVTVTVELSNPLFINSPAGGIKEFQADFVLVNGTTTMAAPIESDTYILHSGEQTYTNSNRSRTFSIKKTLTGITEQKLALGLSMRNRNFYDDNIGVHNYYNSAAAITVTIKEGSYIRMSLMSKNKSKDVYAEMILVHNAFNRIVECISENQLQCKSDWFKTPNSYDAPSGSMSCGNGGLKVITNGYKIRGLHSDGETERNMPISFKDMFEAMDAQDCIGWGFVEENGKLVVRIEQWSWFYKNDVVLSINEPNEKTRAIDTDSIITSLKIGYKKYTTNEDINALDSIHSERTFTSQIKSVSNSKEKLCKFIADNFAIEETRRKAIDADTEEYKYDENIFLFELQCGNGGGSKFSYVIATGRAKNATNLMNSAELYNAGLSPRRMADRWAWRLATFNSVSPLEMTKGTVNYKAAYKCLVSTISPPYYTYYLASPSSIIAEDEMIQNSKPLFRAETLKIKYPITISQYQSIKRNPYGIIVVDNEKHWLKEMKFKFKTGEAELTLIPKNE